MCHRQKMSWSFLLKFLKQFFPQFQVIVCGELFSHFPVFFISTKLLTDAELKMEFINIHPKTHKLSQTMSKKKKIYKTSSRKNVACKWQFQIHMKFTVRYSHFLSFLECASFRFLFVRLFMMQLFLIIIKRKPDELKLPYNLKKCHHQITKNVY